MTTTPAFGTLVKPSLSRKRLKEINYLEKKDKQMRFNNSQDPIYYIFNCIEDRPVSVLAKEFVKDSFMDTVNFISKVVG